MRSLRRHPLAVLLALCGLFGVVAIASAAIGGGEKPKKRPLAVAVHRALTAPAVQGVTARIKFTNSLIGSDSLGFGASPLLTGASGRAWVAKDGRFRLELQAEDGDSQIVSDGRKLTVFDAKQNVVYTARLPREKAASRKRAHEHRPPTLADVQKALKRFARHATLSGAKPTNVAGEPAYAVSVSPKKHGGLLGAVGVAWDAARGTPLSFSITPKGSSKPVLKLAATDISYGRVDSSVFTAPAPPKAKKETVELPQRAGHQAERRPAKRAYARRVARELKAARAALGSQFAAPKTLAGRKRYVVDAGKGKAIVLYGTGLDGIVVLEEKASGNDRPPFRGMGKATIDGVSGQKLATSLGSVVTWTDGDVRTTLLGSMTGKDAEAAANALR